MRGARLILVSLLALTGAGCARHQQPAYYVVDPATGQPVPVVQHYQPRQQYAQYGQVASPQAVQPQAQPKAAGAHERGLFSSSRRARAYAAQSYARQQPYAQPAYAQPAYVQPQTVQRGTVQQQPYGQGYVLQYRPPPAAAPAPQTYAAAPPYGYAYAPAAEQPYTLDSGDRLRVVVFGQEGITGSYMVDASGQVNLPLVGAVPARGFTTHRLTSMIAERLKQGYVREPHVTVEIEAYRPFFILGEVTNPGQYPYVANMTAEKAIAIAGGFAPRANKKAVELTRNGGGQRFKGEVPLNYPLRPGDTIQVKERWF
jgi:polysaccharide export outer membrane protein